jgi:methylase of polypeptide subunit release factors
MKTVLADLFARFEAEVGQHDFACLRVTQRWPVEDSTALRSPIGSFLIHGVNDDGKTEPLALVALTPPHLDTGDPALLQFVIRRALANKAPYILTWTLRDAVLWRTPKHGAPTDANSLEKLRDYEDNYDIAPGDAPQMFHETRRRLLLQTGRHLLDDLKRLHKDQALELVNVDATWFVGRLIESVHELLPLVTDSLHTRLGMEDALRAKVEKWAVTQGIAGSASDRDFVESITRQIIYRLLGKVLFYQSLRRAARQLPPLNVDGLESSEVLPALNRAFAEALKIDYHAVFAEALPDTIKWPAEAAKKLAALIHDFNTRDFSSLPQDVVGTVFERLIPPEERHGFGQYFTGESLCDLTVAFCITSPKDLMLDPTCGTGTFNIRSYDRLRWLGQHDHPTLLSQIWGIDIAPFPAELAVINLFRQNVASSSNFPRIACRDFFTLSPGETLPFPPPKMDVQRPEQVNEPIPQFDAIVGNFPYVSADQIERSHAGYLDLIRKCLIAGWFANYPDLFFYDHKTDQESFEKAIAAGKHADCNRTTVQLRTSTQADLYVYLFFQTSRFLKPGGRMGIVTSNAWLDVNYGYALQRFFCDRFKIVAILESRCEPWFTEASVNTVLTIVERCDNAKQRDDHLVKFVKVKKRLADLAPGDPKIEAKARWGKLEQLAERIEKAGKPYSKTFPLGVTTVEDDDFRIRVCRQSELRQDIEAQGQTVKWGKFLRAPEVFLEIANQKKLVILKEIATPKYGSKTRINEFFHVSQETAQKFAIEKEYLEPFIKSPKDSNSIKIDLSELELRIFVCRRTKKELKDIGHTGALSYILWGEKQTYDRGEFEGLAWPQGTWVNKRAVGWYALPNTETNYGQLFISGAFGDRHVHRFCSKPIIPNNRLYYLHSSTPEVSDKLLAAILNSSLAGICLEVSGRVTMGDGVLEVAVEDARDSFLIPDVRSATPAHKKAIIESFEALCERDIGSVFDEVKQEDRQALDNAVLRAIGLDPKKYLHPIYDSLCGLVRERIELGQMRGKARKTKARKTGAEKQILQDVLTEELPNGPHRFPDEFFSDTAKGEAKTDIELPGKELILDTGGFIPALYAKDKSWNRTVKTPAEGKFLLYAQQAGHKVASVPSKPVEVSRTVANYEGYLRELRKRLYESFYRRTLDARIAATLTQSVFDKFRLPNLET